MAATPKRTLSRTVASTVEDRTPQFLLGWLAIAMVVSLLAGLGIGIKVGEHHKATKKLASLTPTTRKTGKKPTTKRALANAPLVGTVTGKGAKSMVVTTTKGRVVITLIKLTTIETVAAANGSDVKAGRRIRLQFAPNAPTPTTAAGAATTAKPTGATGAATLKAKEILLMPATSKIGSVVTAATPGSVTLTISGRPVVVSTAGTTFDKAVVGTRADLKKGSRVLVRVQRQSVKRGKRTRRITTALEVVVLPVGSTIT